MGKFGCSNVKAMSCTVGSFPVRVCAPNFLGFTQNWWRRTVGIRRELWLRGKPMTDEFDWIARLTPRPRAFAKAIGSGQTTFDGQAEPTADDVHSITRVTDAPVQILGRITPDG